MMAFYARGARPGKYHAKKVDLDGMRFDSAKEARRYQELKLMARAGAISDLEMQVSFELIPAQRCPETGRVIERAVTYKADFVYAENGHRVVEDVKSPATKTREYIIKRKLMLQKYGIRIKEV